MPAGAPLTLATHNFHKLREVQRMLSPWGIEIEGLSEAVELPPEDGDTYAENALGKARAAADALGEPAIADDSGIEAHALAGVPGVRSARYAGPDATDEQNLAKLIREAPAASPLKYVCALAYVDAKAGVERVFFGECRGRLAADRRGTRGFGYDPVFVPDEDGQQRTMAELSDEEKDQISHRGRAVRAFAQWLEGG